MRSKGINLKLVILLINMDTIGTVKADFGDPKNTIYRLKIQQ